MNAGKIPLIMSVLFIIDGVVKNIMMAPAYETTEPVTSI